MRQIDDIFFMKYNRYWLRTFGFYEYLQFYGRQKNVAGDVTTHAKKLKKKVCEILFCKP